jgi:hypothetical protein
VTDDGDPGNTVQRMVEMMCPSLRLPDDELERLVDFIKTVMEQRDKYEAQVSLLQRTTVKAKSVEARVKDILLQYAQFIPDSAAYAADEDVVEMSLPGRLARPLSLVGQEYMLEETVAHLSKRKVKVSALGVAYVNEVHCIGESPKALHLLDKTTQEKFWMPRGQVVHGESEVMNVGDKGCLVVTRWIAEQKGWLPQS